MGDFRFSATMGRSCLVDLRFIEVAVRRNRASVHQADGSVVPLVSNESLLFVTLGPRLLAALDLFLPLDDPLHLGAKAKARNYCNHRFTHVGLLCHWRK